MKVPVLCDYDNFATIKRNPSEPYFLYCGSDSFIEVAEFVLKAYQAMENKSKVKLYLLISGIQKHIIELFQEEVNKMFPEGNVQLFSNVPYQELMQLFTDANALLIPLRPTVEDRARFPHKIGEYLATGNPVITTKVGEIETYFEDGTTALVSEKYEINEFSEKMDYVVDNYDHAREIGLQGKEMGLKTFSFTAYGASIKQFLMKL
jgi:glycosyltransferase involved in cell wall biosynthesis